MPWSTQSLKEADIQHDPLSIEGLSLHYLARLEYVTDTLSNFTPTSKNTVNIVPGEATECTLGRISSVTTAPALNSIKNVCSPQLPNHPSCSWSCNQWLNHFETCHHFLCMIQHAEDHPLLCLTQHFDQQKMKVNL